MTDQANLDRLIDDVARGITAHEPPAHLRTRVLARLDERRAPRRSWLWIPVAASAAAVLLTVVVINKRPAHLPEAAPLASSTANTQVTPDRVEIAAPVLEAKSGYGAIAVASRRDASSRESAAWREELMPSLPAIAALGITEIQPDMLAIPQLTVKPLVVAPIDDGSQR